MLMEATLLLQMLILKPCSIKGFLTSSTNHIQIQLLHLLPRPGRFPEESQAGFDGWIMRKASHWNHFTQLCPAIMVYQPADDVFQFDTVKGVVRLTF